MHKTLYRQLRKLRLDEKKFPENIDEWQLFLDRVDTSYTQSDEGMYTLKRSSDIAAAEMEALNEKLSMLASFPEENAGPVMRFSQVGIIEYCNPNGLLVLNHWGFKVNDVLNNRYLTVINKVLSSNTELILEQEIDEIIYSLRIVPIVGCGYVNVYGTDITRLKTIESTLVTARDQAELANVEKSRFLANMSHELRTPMHGILGFVSLCIKLVKNEKITGYLKNIEKSAIRLTDLLNNILDLSKLESGKMEVHFEKANLTELVNHCVEELETLYLEKELNVALGSQQVIEGCLDKALITQVIINLLSNAIRFSPTGGLIDITLKKYEYCLHNENEMVLELVVSDQGPGVPEDELESIFNKFIQSSKTVTKAGGTGLGLSICEEIILVHNGRIWAENNVVYAGAAESNNLLQSGASLHFIIPVNRLTDYE
jgi:signal transduction histidine kinase